MKRGGPDHPKTFALAEALGIRRVYAVGYLEMLFHFTAQYAPAGDVGRYSDKRIAAGMDWVGNPAKLIESLIATHWLDPHPVARLVVHDWSDHADRTTLQRLSRAGRAPIARVQLDAKTEEQGCDTGVTRSPLGCDSGVAQVQQGSDYSSDKSLSQQNHQHTGKLCAQSESNTRTPPSLALPEPEPEPEPIPPVVPQGGREPLFETQTAEVGSSVVRSSVPAKNGKARTAKTATLHCEAEWTEYLAIHPKNTIQTVMARNLWAEKVKDQALARWLIEQLRREAAGDTTYLLGPGKWLQQHLELYAAGVKPSEVKAPTMPLDSYERHTLARREAFRNMMAREWEEKHGKH